MWKGPSSPTILSEISRFIIWYTRLLNNPSRSTRALSLAVLIVITFFSVLGMFSIIDPYPLKDWIFLRLTLIDLGFFGGIVFVLSMSVLSLVSPISLFIMTGSASFGPFYGIILSYIGALLNANLTFYLVKALSIDRKWERDRKSVRIRRNIKSRGYPLVLFLQLITVIPFVAINSAAAAAGVRWKDFMKATSMGVLPSILIYSFIAEKVASRYISPRIYFAFIIVMALYLIIIALRKKKKRPSNRDIASL